MKLSPPKQGSWAIASLLGVVGIIAHQVEIPLLSEFAFWLVVAGFGLLVLATLFRGI